MNSHLIIRLCRHTFPDGRRCLAPAVRARACCRHHLDARTRLQAMARNRRVASFPRLFTPMNRRELAMNRVEVNRVIQSGTVDFETARLLHRCMHLLAATFPAEPVNRPRNPNVFYYKPISRLFCQSYIDKVSEVSENTSGQRGVHTASR
jgi:hypothetical protein